jgi:hypothetical protein
MIFVIPSSVAVTFIPQVLPHNPLRIDQFILVFYTNRPLKFSKMICIKIHFLLYICPAGRFDYCSACYKQLN